MCTVPCGITTASASKKSGFMRSTARIALSSFIEELRKPQNFFLGILQAFNDTTQTACFYHFRNRCPVVRDRRCSARHRLDHNESEWLRPVNGEKQCVSISQELVLFFVADFPDAL